MPTPDSGPSATLEVIKERSAAALEFPASGFAEDSIRACTQSALDVPSLVAALEAVLKLADEYDVPPHFLDDVTAAKRSLALKFREAITRSLKGDADA